MCTSCKKLGLLCTWPQSNEFAWRQNMGIEGDLPTRQALDSLSQVLSRIKTTQRCDAPTSLEEPESPPIASSPSSLSPNSPILSFSDFITGHLNELIGPFPADDEPPSLENRPTDNDLYAKPATATPASPSKRAGQSTDDSLTPYFLSTISGAWASLDSISQRVLLFYIDYTSERMIPREPGTTNVWKSTILQLAETDELVLNAVLALGSIHLAAGQGNNHPVAEANSKYMLRCITGLQPLLKDWVGSTTAIGDDTLRLMLVTCLLAEHECIGGNLNGTLQLHLRGCYPAARVLESRKTSSQMELVAHLLEHTALLQFSSALRFPRPGDKSGNVWVDISRMVQDGRFTLLKSFESFGAYFGCSADLYEKVPRLHKFYATRQLEITTGRDLGCSLDFKRLLFELSSWRPIQDRSQDHYNHTEMWLNDIGGYQRSEHRAAQDEANKRREFEQSPMIAAAYAVQNMLILFLYSAYLRHREDLDRLAVATRPIVDESLDIIDRIKGSSWENTTWWPMVIIGSYATTPEHRGRLLSTLCALSPPMGIVSRGIELLKEIWNSPDDVFGLEGLAKVVGASEAYCFG
ncbi:hypothetical protein FALCPG4_007553 [Fusarium falciforme]